MLKSWLPAAAAALITLIPWATRAQEVFRGRRGELRPDLGHIHLQVTDLAESARFYQGVLGLDITQSDFPGALFLSGEGYHHHVGLNVWNSRRGLTLQKKSLGLDSFAIGAAGPGELARIRLRVGAHGVTLTSDSPNRLDLVDPDGIPVAIIA